MGSKIVIFGAGSIGRSFIGQLFSRGGWEVVFVDIDAALIGALNRAGRYSVVVRETGAADEEIVVAPVRGLLGSDAAAVSAELAGADCVATSVGKNALKAVFPLLARGIEARTGALDIIIAENLHGGARFFREGLLPHLSDPRILERVGLVETSIGKMVPIMRAEDLEADPLLLCTEAYNTLIVDREGFLGEIPRIGDIAPVAPISAWVDRKLYIHNLGHAAAAYLGYRRNPAYTWIWEPLEDAEVLTRVRGAMREAGEALLCEYPGVFGREETEEHIEDLLRRFRNRALGDTIHRVGRDLRRKLAPGDRLLGAFDIIRRHGLPAPSLAEVIEAACGFAKGDETGELFPGDREFAADRLLLSEIAARGIKY